MVDAAHPGDATLNAHAEARVRDKSTRLFVSQDTRRTDPLMKVGIRIKNLRCFTDSQPVHFVLQDGFTAFIGVNNSGKSTLLRMFFELRSLFQNLYYQLAAALNHDQNFPLPQQVLDPSEIFNNTNSRDLEIDLDFECLTDSEPSALRFDCTA